MTQPIDNAKLNFNQDSLLVLNICLAVVMFGVALGLRTSDFVSILKSPKPILLGLFSQFLVLPALSFLLIYISKPAPSIALGMIMVAACPGGNVSNFISQLAGGNSALSVSLTAFSTAISLFFTPFNLSFWGSLYPPTNQILQEVSLVPADVFKTIVIILGIPLISGMIINHGKPALSAFLGKILRPLSILILLGIVGIAFYNNMEIFLEYIHLVVILVFFHNAIALAAGYSIGKAGGLSYQDKRTLSIETGIQNSALGLILIFGFFDGLGGMAIVAGWWGIWHLIAGLSLAYWWRYKHAKPAIS